MTDRLKGVCVCFDRDIREDDAEVVISAIRQIRGVLSVEVNVADSNDWMNRERIRDEMTRKIYEALK